MTQPIETQKTIVEIFADARAVAGKLAKVEERATASQTEINTFNAKMLEMMNGTVMQTADNNIATLANEQKKHLRKLEAVRKNAGEDAANLRALGETIAAEIERLTAPYAVEQAETVEGEVGDIEQDVDAEDQE